MVGVKIAPPKPLGFPELAEKGVHGGAPGRVELGKPFLFCSDNDEREIVPKVSVAETGYLFPD
jgi:hypothetical protein